MRCFGVLVLLSAVLVPACGSVVANTNPDASVLAGEDALDAAAVPLPLPQEVRGLQVTPDGFVANAAIEIGGGLVVVGTRNAADSSSRDAFILRESAQGTMARFTGGAQNDQLYAVASNGTTILGVGLTRSFLGTMTQDQILLAFMSTGSDTISLGRLYVAADEAVQPRTVTSYSAGWVIGGHHRMGARAFLAMLNPDGTPQRAVSFVVGGVSSALILRRVIVDGTRVYAVGSATQGARRIGLVAAFDASTLAPLWSQRVENAAADVQLLDATLIVGTLRTVGQSGSHGLIVDLDVQNGKAQSMGAWDGTAFHSVLVHDDRLWLAGRSGGASFGGFIHAGTLYAAQLSDLSLFGLSSQSLVARGYDVSVLGSRAAGLVEVPLNGTPVGACNDTAFGAPITVSGSAASVAADTAVIDSHALTLTHAMATPTTSPATVSPFDACL